jgi:PhzF family phenazine biosynthesis protein
MNVLKLAAFSHNGKGGNPAGVVFNDAMPKEEEMLKVAKEVGYSETAFLVRQADDWRVRYFAPDMEVPFCGHMPRSHWEQHWVNVLAKVSTNWF